MVQNSRLGFLIYRSSRNELTPAEEIELNVWINASAENRHFYEQELDPERQKEAIGAMLQMNTVRMQTRLEEFKSGKHRPFLHRWMYVAAAGLTGIVLIASGVFSSHFRNTQLTKQVIASTQSIIPGGNKAILTLDNGHALVLDSVQNGTIARQGSSQVIKTANGQLAYTRTGGSGPVGFNVITTPKGGQYQVTLSDGTNVWLNAASSLKFPTAFSGDLRVVEITGEAYFEVARNKTLPFHVRTGDVDILVLGTAFNVMAYPDERAVKATLIAGSVKVAVSDNTNNAGTGVAASSDGQSRVVLRPGQQAQIAPTVIGVNSNNGTTTNNGGDNEIRVVDADVDEEISWKNGVTSFKDGDIKSIMRKIARWYDVDISYEGEIPERKFMGGIPRSSSFSDLIKVLDLNHIHTRVEGKKLIVMP